MDALTPGHRAQVHDLLRLASPRSLHWEQAPQAWARQALAAAPWVVARRAPARAGRIAVGVRGAQRTQRAAAWVDVADVDELLRPSELRARAAGLDPARRALGAFGALAQLERAWAEIGPGDWGPAGSAGFELASAWACVGPVSDLDIVVRCARAPARARARAWLDALPRQAAARIDVLLEWPAGGAALTEFAAGGSYLLRSPRGARLRAAPGRA
jgi:phosphoribosyl-dephospho-CoA transferase